MQTISKYGAMVTRKDSTVSDVVVFFAPDDLEQDTYYQMALAVLNDILLDIYHDENRIDEYDDVVAIGTMKDKGLKCGQLYSCSDIDEFCNDCSNVVWRA